MRIAQQRLAEQVDVAERRAYEVRGPGWVMQQYTYWVEIIGYNRGLYYPDIQGL